MARQLIKPGDTDRLVNAKVAANLAANAVGAFVQAQAFGSETVTVTLHSLTFYSETQPNSVLPILSAL